jgi:hypothetical protein
VQSDNYLGQAITPTKPKQNKKGKKQKNKKTLHKSIVPSNE